MKDRGSAESREFVTRGGNVLEFGAVTTFGVRELRISPKRILLESAVGGEYEFSSEEVRRITLERRKGALGLWFGVEFVDGTTPDVFFGGRRQAIVDALEDRGWRVEVHS